MLHGHGWRVRALDVRHGQLVRAAGTKLRIDVTYAENPDNLPERLWIKAGWEEHSALMEEAKVYAREANFYADLCAQAGVRAPRCFAAR